MKTINAELMPVSCVSGDDARNFIQWMYQQRGNTMFDPEVLSYARSCMAKAATETETLAMVPFSPVFMVESLASKPGLTRLEKVQCLSAISNSLDSIAAMTGHGEGYFVTSDDQYAETASHHGWEKYMFDPVKHLYLMKRKFHQEEAKS